MTDYITLTINSEFLNNFLYILFIFIIVWMFFLLFEGIQDTIKRNKKRQLELIAKPYKKEYERLERDGSSKERLDYYEKYKKYINYGSYF